jgi:hypothetical protein
MWRLSPDKSHLGLSSAAGLPLQGLLCIDELAAQLLSIPQLHQGHATVDLRAHRSAACCWHSIGRRNCSVWLSEGTWRTGRILSGGGAARHLQLQRLAALRQGRRKYGCLVIASGSL